ncbi:MAG: tetratricopeptide repeat protein [Planctomycetota bacterium]
MELTTETVQQLMEIGYVAAGAGRFADADAIFAAVQAARPESEYPQIGRAVVCLNADRTPEAIAILRGALQINPDSDLAMAFLGFALRQAGLTQQSDEVLKQVIDAGGQPEAVAVARSLLDP